MLFLLWHLDHRHSVKCVKVRCWRGAGRKLRGHEWRYERKHLDRVLGYVLWYQILMLFSRKLANTEKNGLLTIVYQAPTSMVHLDGIW